VYFVLLSTVAGILLLVVFLLSPESGDTIRRSGNTLVSAAFLASCVLCLSMTISPNWIGRALGRHSRMHVRNEPGDSQRRFRGHHPDCVRFNDHRLSVGRRSLCPGCVGLMVGAIVAIALMAFCVIFVDDLSRGFSLALLVGGLCTVSFALFEASIRRRDGAVHLVANALMIVGFLLLVVAMMSVGGAVPGLIAVAFSYLWIDARIELSLWRHNQVCSECPQKCKMY